MLFGVLMCYALFGLLAMSADVDYDQLSFVVSSRYRTDVMLALMEQPRTPSELAEDTGDGIAHMSRALQTLKEKGLVELLVSESRQKSRFYGLTDEGRQIAENVEERQ